MCGIVGIIGSATPEARLLSMLRRLEYRGYDSAGLAIHSGPAFAVTKRAGRLDVLEKALAGRRAGGTCGIGHTRWATHGAPSDANAHPFVSTDGQVAVVHNGIIENYRELKRELLAAGCVFTSDTDSEVVCHLAAAYRRADPGFTFPGLVSFLTARLKGAFAILVAFLDRPGELFGLRFECPLAFVLGSDASAVSSDISSLVDVSPAIRILKDGQALHLTRESFAVADFDGRAATPTAISVDWNVEQAEKGGHAHFLRKEIGEQPQALRAFLSTLTDACADLKAFLSAPAPASLLFLACGSASYSCAFASLLARAAPAQSVAWDIGSEFRYRPLATGPGALVVCMSQSGETADTLSSFREAQRTGSRSLSFVNVVGSTLDLDSDLSVRLSAGPEIAVPSTKAVINQFVAAATVIEMLRRGSAFDFPAWAGAIRRLAEAIEEIIALEPIIADLARFLSGHQNIFAVGRGLDYPIALEAALKLKETAYIHAEAMHAGEFKHGSISLIERGMPVIAFFGDETVRDKTVSNAEEVKARGARVVAIDPHADGAGGLDHLGDVLRLPACPQPFACVAQIVAAQLLAYHAGVIRRVDVDKPRNLAKSVTVE